MADVDLNEDERIAELSTNTYIFPELMVDPADCYSASIRLPVSPAEPLAVTFASQPGVATALPTPPSSTDTNDDDITAREATLNAVTSHLISHLPPLVVKITLPEGYPATEPPIIHLEAECSWLPKNKLEELEAFGRVHWEHIGKDQVVFTYIDHLQQAAENCFGLSDGPSSPLELPPELEIELLDYDLEAKRSKFEQETFECGICLEPKKGSGCHQLLLCSHVFCVPCLQDFYNACITEGDVTKVKCLAPDCGKDVSNKAHNGEHAMPKRKRKVNRTLDPSELLQIPLDQEVVQRYVKLKRKNLLESDRSTVYCPRQWCQGAARSKKYPKVGTSTLESTADSEDEEDPPEAHDRNTSEKDLPPPSERLAICEDCAFAFCKVCKASWHGEFAVCYPRKQHELTAEEKASEEYLKMHSTPCPTCNARCQKTMGCNHMICFKCNTHFCYLCSAWLKPEDPYKHFNTLWTPCYMRLWELEEGDGVGVDRRAYERALEEEDENDAREADLELPPPESDTEAEAEGPAVDAPIIVPIQPPAPQAPQMNLQPLNGVRVNARVQQGLARPARREPLQGQGVQALQRFLQLAELDEEDQWESDGSEDDRWVIPVR
ncbi:translation termination inhibitor protein itt1 [Lambiella insularis]|nr:translation termination inhibitor protein itt1 [Lambiella insularis]